MGIDVTQNHDVDLSASTAASINELRRAFRLQEWLERNARGGTRYIEIIMAHFGVKSSDARLQRPEFLGGSSTPITISEVLQTSDNSGGTEGGPQGTFRTSLKFWHMGRIFAGAPSLNQDFIECDYEEVKRVFADPTSEHLYVYLHNEVKATRLMPYFGTPTI